jgi:DUF4097 and DUF4098 domain-containing protein YvlB
MNQLSFSRTVFVSAAMLILVAASAEGQEKTYSQRMTHRAVMDPHGSLLIENAVGTGSIQIVGSDDNAIDIVAHRLVRAADDATVEEGKKRTMVIFQGNPRVYALRTLMQPSPGRKWNFSVSYVVKVPRSVEVTVTSHSGEGISIANISGGVVVKNVNGPIRLTSVMGPTRVESINGNITVQSVYRPSVNAYYSTINGDVDLIVPQESSFQWAASTLKGDFASVIPVRGSVGRGSSTTLRAAINGGQIPLVTTVSVTGRVSLMHKAEDRTRVKSLLAQSQASPPQRAMRPTGEMATAFREVSGILLQPPTARTFVQQSNLISGNFKLEDALGNLFLREIRGNANISTRAGEIVIGLVHGDCEVTSFGGPINLGEVMGEVQARTAAGDISIRSARKGGVLNTDGGNVHVLFAGGPIDVRSGGGDVTIRNASGGVRAQTKSGDVNLTVDQAVRSQRLEMSTVGGNIVLNVPPSFAGDFEITVIATDAASAEKVHSAFSGLSIQRDQIGGKTRIRARGKVNGGGERVSIYVEEGDVHLRVNAVGPVAGLR